MSVGTAIADADLRRPASLSRTSLVLPYGHPDRITNRRALILAELG